MKYMKAGVLLRVAPLPPSRKEGVLSSVSQLSESERSVFLGHSQRSEPLPASCPCMSCEWSERLELQAP